MLENKEELKNKIIYRASYRGSKEMDILMTGFVNSLINDLSLDELKELDYLVNLDVFVPMPFMLLISDNKYS